MSRRSEEIEHYKQVRQNNQIHSRRSRRKFVSPTEITVKKLRRAYFSATGRFGRNIPNGESPPQVVGHGRSVNEAVGSWVRQNLDKFLIEVVVTK